MRRGILIALLSLGTVGGFTAGALSFTHCRHHRREAFERHVARVCVEAARNAGPPAATGSSPEASSSRASPTVTPAR
ncbi:MAG: hypothetical protein IT371_00050 [Deltaproteobacteria bacterium]|nr:hypothetical protein [Deltaproteobacteria bacterium]